MFCAAVVPLFIRRSSGVETASMPGWMQWTPARFSAITSSRDRFDLTSKNRLKPAASSASLGRTVLAQSDGITLSTHARFAAGWSRARPLISATIASGAFCR